MMEEFGACAAKTMLLKWFEGAAMIVLDEAQFFGSKVFDCFYVDIGRNTIALRLQPNVKCKNKYFDDSYEIFAAAYHDLNPEMDKSSVAVFQNVPFEDLLKDRVEEHAVECAYVCKEADFLASCTIPPTNICPTLEPAA